MVRVLKIAAFGLGTVWAFSGENMTEIPGKDPGKTLELSLKVSGTAGLEQMQGPIPDSLASSQPVRIASCF